jgi:mannose-6-phosphate isomerase-like protein (cupin superfamily)
MDYPVETDTGTGERLRLVRVHGEGAEAWLEIEGRAEPGVGPPMHVHFFQDEGMRVEAGRLGYVIGDGEPRYAEVGEEVIFRAGEVHRFWNAGEGEMRGVGWVSPVGNFPWFITRLHDSIRRNGGRPGLFEGAFLMRRYASEFDMMEIPSPVKRFVFPLLVALGGLLGKYRAYADAPEPMREDPRGRRARNRPSPLAAPDGGERASA